MMKRIFFLLQVLMTLQSVYGQMQITIAPFYQDRLAAVSYTFDDGLQDQFTLARSELNRRGIRSTFAVIGSKVGGIMRSSQDRQNGTDGTPCMTWDMLRQLCSEGHEVSSHGWEHRNVTKLSPEALRYEVQHNDTVIFEQTGHFPRTYFYPGNAKNDEAVAFCCQDRVGTRTRQVSIGSKRSIRWLNQWIDSLLAKGEWGVGMTHGIAEGYDHFTDPQVLWQHLDYVCTLQDRLWIAPFCEVAAYGRERENVQLDIRESDDGITVTPICTLDSTIFSHPLTLRLKGYHAMRAKQGGKELKIYGDKDCQLVDFNPHGGSIIFVDTQ